MTRVLLGGRIAYGRAKYGFKWRVWCERHALEIHVAGWYVGIYR